MVKVYAVVLSAGLVALVAWIVFRALAVNIERHAIDPEQRLGVAGRRAVAAMVGFGMAGMSAEFSPRGITWPLALALALAGAGAAGWYAGRVDREETESVGRESR
ncbi:hypothetical protein BH23ACT5_BH23ACT5_11820 [soil metagenome]